LVPAAFVGREIAEIEPTRALLPPPQAIQLLRE
jgi:hypothetical protein